jgi:VWFA-related protein
MPARVHPSSLAATIVIGAMLSTGPAAITAARQATFRSGTDVIAVDVQVVDRNGRPIPQLAPDRFEVEIGGHRRRIVSVDLIQYADFDAPSRLPASADGAPIQTAPPRTYVIGMDVSSFSIAESRTVLEGAREFIAHLQPDDRVGIYAFPIGPKFLPTTDHAAIARRLDGITGSREALHSSYGLSAMDVIDMTADAAKGGAMPIAQSPLFPGRGAQPAPALTSETLDRIVTRECGADDRPCAQAVLSDAVGMSFVLEGQATESLNGLRRLVHALNTIDGYKTLVLLSAGMPASDRPGGRPEVGDLPKLLGQEAAEANTTIYALFLDSAFLQTSARTNYAPDAGVSAGRQRTVLGHVMEEFSAASGGAFLAIAQGAGTVQFDRVLRETSSRYLLGVEAAPADRDGTRRRLSVKVKNLDRSAVVRSRQWVVVPRVN